MTILTLAFLYKNLDYKPQSIKLNVSKTHYMIFHRARIKTIDHDNISNGNVVKCVTSTKFLGIIVDGQFRWKQHNDYIKNNLLNLSELFTKLEIMLTDIH